MTETIVEIEITPEMEDVVDFINEIGITMHVLLIHENPHRTKQQGVHWSCKVFHENRFIIVYFSKGAEIRRWSLPTMDTIPLHVPHGKIGDPYDGPLPPFETEQDKRTFALCSIPEPPFLLEVIDLLARDIWLLEQAGTFDKWIQMVGLSTDRAAREAFDRVCQQRIGTLHLLGEGAYHKLLYEIDRPKLK